MQIALVEKIGRIINERVYCRIRKDVHYENDESKFLTPLAPEQRGDFLYNTCISVIPIVS